ncbi:MAG: type VI secretion system baseplate subunit TssK [Planctomycetes bacterium]|nr:type VI secretion system baseplate subunit TssK [Planctomycetota bacterium]
MSSMGHIHWHEGLFLQPHHLQTFSRQQAETVWRERRLGWAYPYGVIDCRISTDALETMLVRIDRLRAVMPSGLEIDVPGNTDVPALDIKKTFANTPGGFTVSIAVPLWQSERANTVEENGTTESARVKRLFRVGEITRADENTGENTQPVLVRRVNARLVVDGDDTTDMEVLPLLRIVASAEGSTLPRLDARFIPPCMVISGNPGLKNLLRDLGSAVEAARKEVVNQLTRGGFVLENLKGPQLLMLMRLRTLNRFAGTLPTLFAGGPGGAGAISPFDAYLILRELLGELAALSPERDQFEASRYEHDLPGVVFGELDRKIRPLLRGDIAKRFLQVPFVMDGGVLAASLTEEHFTAPNGYFLGVRTKMDPTRLGKLVEDQDKFKLMPKTMIKLNIFGVKLQEERHPPMELPSAVDLHYFRLDAGQSAKMWERVQSEKSMALRWSETDPMEYTDVSLYMTVP